MINIIGALSLIRYCLTPDPSNRATTKDILRHDWLVHGPVLSLRLHSTATPTMTSSLPLNEQLTQKDYEKVRLRTPTTNNEKSTSPNNSLVELELHTSSFFDSTKLRDKNKEQQRRNRVSAIPESTNYYTSKGNSSSVRSTPRRPLSLTLDDSPSTTPFDYHFTSTSEKPSSQFSSPPAPSTTTTSNQPYTRRSRRTTSPISNKSTSTTYATPDRIYSPAPSHRYTLATSPDATRRATSPSNPSRYLVSYDFDSSLRDLKRKPIFKYTPPHLPATSDLNVVPSLSNSTTPVAPSVFTTSAVKFATPPTRRMSPFRDPETNPISTGRFLNHTISNPSSNLDDSINKATTNHNPRSYLTSYDLPSSTNNIRKSRLLDDNNNLISLKVHD